MNNRISSAIRLALYSHARSPRQQSAVAPFLMGVSSAALLAPAAALAQDNADSSAGALEEVVVTASKRGDQFLQNMATSIRAITSEDLEKANIQDFEDWVGFVPGVTFKDLGPGEKTIVTRGLVSTGAATTAVYFDETNITAFNDGEGGGRNVDFKLFDLERIEVLRGPQGTLYGASALGGTIRIISAKPDLTEWSASAEMELSSTKEGSGNYAARGHINLPIVPDVFGIRLAAWAVDNSGYIDNIRLGNSEINDEETVGARLTARWQATENLTLTATAMTQEQDIGDSSRFNQVGDDALIFPGETPFSVTDELQVTDFTRNPRQDDPTILSLVADYQTSFGSFVATTSLYDREVLFNFDSTPILLFFGVPIRAISSFPEDREIWSNEIRFSSDFDGRVQFVGGLYHQEEDLESESNVWTVDANGNINESSPSVLSVLRDRSFDETAIFGELTVNITDQWDFTVGARYAEFDFVTDENAVVPFFGPPMGPEPTKSGDDSSSILKFNTSYQVNDDVMVYATASEGFRRGGLNLNAFGDLFDIPETFGSDELWNYEVGVKSSWFEDKLIVNATLYTLDWSDIQLETVSELGGVEFFTNAGKARVNGIELELFARPVAGLNLSAAIGYTDAELTEDAPPINIPPLPSEGQDGDSINNVPDLTASFAADYTWTAFGGWDATVGGALRYTGDSDTRIAANRDPFNVHLPSSTIVDLRAGLGNDNWRVEFFIENLTDERAINDAINEVTNILAFFTNRPRTTGVRVNYQF
ncbi:TonB-dependent receptor [Elongatibacter sediminis]|uniref:TonB-dependent receptor n=1 Tax=Elongatibacter sediminis TaxID=3119006 RepID=A0AAW9R7X2_9GAMM